MFINQWNVWPSSGTIRPGLGWKDAKGGLVQMGYIFVPIQTFDN